MKLFLLLTTISALSQAQVIRTNVGGAQYIDSSGATWLADNSFAGGIAYAGLTAPSGIANTSDPLLYTKGRTDTNSFSYSYTIPDGIYYVRLHFAETLNAALGQRIFQVKINNSVVLSNFDIRRIAGPNAALDLAFTVTNLGAPLTIQFSRISGAPVVSAIDLTYLFNVATGTSFPSSCNLGQLFFRSDQPAGQNLYGCDTAGTPGHWSLQSGSGSGTVTHTPGPLTSGLPVIGNTGADIGVGTRTGNTTKYASASGVFVSGVCKESDASGNLIDAVSGLPCGAVATGATVPSGACTPGAGYANITPTPIDLYVCGPSATWQRIITTQDNVSGKICLPGITSGQACITVNDIAGTPNDLRLPTTTGALGQVIGGNGGNPQQLTWVNNGGALFDACAANVGSWEPFGPVPGVSVLATVINTVYGIELPANSPLCTFTKVVYAVSGAGTGHVAWFIYDSTATNLLATASAADATNATLSVSFASPFQFQANTTYQLLYTSDSVDNIKLVANSDSGFMNIDSPRSYTCQNSASWVGAVVTPPATCGTKTAVSTIIPMIAFHH